MYEQKHRRSFGSEEISKNRLEPNRSHQSLDRLNNPDYRPAAELAQKNFAHSHTSLVEEDEPDFALIEQELERRFTQVFATSYQHSLEEVSKFVRLKVLINVQGVADSTELVLLIDRSQTIEKLAQQIEAEYAFMHVKEDDKSSAEEADKLIDSLRVVAVRDIGQVPLKFNQAIEEVLNNGDSVHAMGIKISGNRTGYLRDTLKKRMENLKQFWKHKEDADAVVKFNNEQRLMHLLHHVQSGVFYFQEFCMEDFEIENLLFWLEIEVFKGSAKEATRLSNNNEKLIGMFDKQYPALLLHARYIYFTFLAPFSPLKLNLRTDLMETFDWPLPQIERVTGLHRPLRMNQFDQIQENTYHYLAYHVYPRFENSSLFNRWIEDRVLSGADSWIVPGEHYKRFAQDTAGMEKAVEEALVQQDAYESEQQPLVRKGYQNAFQQTSANERPRISHLSPPPTNDRRMSSAYFGNGPKITAAQKQRRINREKRLKKFFGEKPVTIDPYADAAVSQFGIAAMEDIFDDLASNAEKTAVVPAYVPPPSEADAQNEDIQYRKKKVEKLEDFFGVARLPPEQLFEQKLVREWTREFSHGVRLNAESEVALEAPPTQNNLSPKAKRRLMQKQKKLKEMLGDNVNEAELHAALYGSIVLDAASEEESAAESANPRTDDEADKSGMASLSGQRRASRAASLVSISGQAKRIMNEKDLRRKKMEKIQQFLGERISARIIEEAATKPKANTHTMTLKERSAYTRRYNKLRGMFGEAPPSDSIALPSNEAEDNDSESIKSAVADIFGGEAILEYLLSHEKDMEDLIQLLEEFDREEGVLEQVEHDVIQEDEDVSKSRDEVKQRIARQVHQARQRMRIGKLQRFFGSPAGPISSELSTEDKIMHELSLHLKGVISPTLLRNMRDRRAQEMQQAASQVDETLPSGVAKSGQTKQ